MTSASSTEICTLTQQEPLEETIKTQITSLRKQMHKGIKGPGLFPFLLFRQLTLWILCIHPFNDGNGRMSRLLTLLLLYRAGYIAGKYISMEMLIEKTKTTYYEALQASSFGWHENQNTYAPFVKYYLGIIIKAYDEFEDRIQYLVTKKISKPDRIKAIISQTLGKISKKDLMERCPDISQGTIERTLSSLVKEGYIIKVGSGPATAYIRKR